jgi:phosphoenolpyruvate carboxylase
MYLALLSQPPGSIDGSIRVTEQGEMIQAKFGLTGIALRNLDLSVGGTLSATLAKGVRPKAEWRALMDQLAEKSSGAYRSVVRGHPNFLEYFTQATPVTELGRLNIGSRPARRRGAPTLQTLRAIPWIFAWTQTRLMLPVWLGVGEAMGEVLASDDRDTLNLMAREWPFLSSTLALVEMVLAKADVRIAECYEKELLSGQDALLALGRELRNSLQLAQDSVLAVIGEKELLATNAVLKRSIYVRNPYVDPINLVQIEIMKRLRLQQDSSLLQDGLLLTINGISAGMRITG